MVEPLINISDIISYFSVFVKWLFCKLFRIDGFVIILLDKRSLIWYNYAVKKIKKEV